MSLFPQADMVMILLFIWCMASTVSVTPSHSVLIAWEIVGLGVQTPDLRAGWELPVLENTKT
jgi:hypothetical protein